VITAGSKLDVATDGASPASHQAAKPRRESKNK